MYRVQLPDLVTNERRKRGRVVEVKTWPGVVELQAQGGVLLDELHAETLRALEGAPAETPVAVIPPSEEPAQPSEPPPTSKPKKPRSRARKAKP